MEEVNAFVSPGEYSRFMKFINEQVVLGNLVEVEVDPDYSRGEIYGGRWFMEISSGITWRLVPPDPPFLGLWERVQI